jgi:hypothetical protein
VHSKRRDGMNKYKQRKKQEDRLLKRLSLKERREQQQLRKLIINDPMFKTI